MKLCYQIHYFAQQPLCVPCAARLMPQSTNQNPEFEKTHKNLQLPTVKSFPSPNYMGTCTVDSSALWLNSWCMNKHYFVSMYRWRRLVHSCKDSGRIFGRHSNQHSRRSRPCRFVSYYVSFCTTRTAIMTPSCAHRQNGTTLCIVHNPWWTAYFIILYCD